MCTSARYHIILGDYTFSHIQLIRFSSLHEIVWKRAKLISFVPWSIIENGFYTRGVRMNFTGFLVSRVWNIGFTLNWKTIAKYRKYKTMKYWEGLRGRQFCFYNYIKYTVRAFVPSLNNAIHKYNSIVFHVQPCKFTVARATRLKRLEVATALIFEAGGCCNVPVARWSDYLPFLHFVLAHCAP